jgi:hypothetical protein
MPNDQQMTELTGELRLLREHIEVLREVLDEIRSELRWANNNAHDLPGDDAMTLIRRVTSMSSDPAAVDFKVNDVEPEVIAQLREAVASPSVQQELF